jgi:hypothetical protein
MGVALSQTVLARREQFHQSRLVEHLGSWNPFYNDTLNRIQGYLNGRAATGSSSGTSMAIVNQMVHSQATLLAYIDVFVALGVIAVVMVPLALTLRTVNRSAGAKSTPRRGLSRDSLLRTSGLGQKTEVAPLERHVRSTLQERTSSGYPGTSVSCHQRK